MNRPQQNLADYMVIAISPALVILMVGSLIYFLIAVGYSGPHPARLCFIATMFTVASVLIARIAMEQGRSYANLYAAPLALATMLAMAQYSDSSIFLNILLLAVACWCADRLTWDCTLVERSHDPSQQGLLQTAGLASLDRLDPGESPRLVRLEGEGVVTAAVRAPEAALEDVKKIWQRRPNYPGVWIVYFSLAALPLFGFGQWLIPAHDSATRRYVYFLLCVYLASGLGLLSTTSFLGLRLYLRNRRLQMPGHMAAVWLGAGAAKIIALLLTVSLLTFVIWMLPGSTVIDVIAELPLKLISPDDLRPSRFGVGRDGTDSDKTRSNSTSAKAGGPANRTPDQQEGRQSKPAGSGSPSAADSGGQVARQDQSGSQKANDSQSGSTGAGGQSKSGKDRPGQGSPGQKRSEQGRSGQGRSGQGRSEQGRSEQGQSKQGQSKQGQSKQGRSKQGRSKQGRSEQSRSEQSRSSTKNRSGSLSSGGNPRQSDDQRDGMSNGASRSSSGQSDQTQGTPTENSKANEPSGDQGPSEEARRGSGERQQTESSTEAFRGARESLGRFSTLVSQMIKWLIRLAVMIVALFFAWIYREELLRALSKFLENLRELWQLLFGRVPVRPDQPANFDEPIQSEPPRPFASFQDPFLTGTAEELPPDELVRYSFEAFEAWARERGCPRQPEQTPHELAQNVTTREPSLKSAARLLADQYCHVAYAPGSLQRPQVRKLAKVWERLRSVPAAL